mmetsp:Transcript_33370/g.87873  ORF Transcript_33370/g.87873 Transcript_33370/m.87873 type:complete len:265 (+) Transcript_33370:800-1594(+)
MMTRSPMCSRSRADAARAPQSRAARRHSPLASPSARRRRCGRARPLAPHTSCALRGGHTPARRRLRKTLPVRRHWRHRRHASCRVPQEPSARSRRHRLARRGRTSCASCHYQSAHRQRLRRHHRVPHGRRAGARPPNRYGGCHHSGQRPHRRRTSESRPPLSGSPGTWARGRRGLSGRKTRVPVRGRGRPRQSRASPSQASASDACARRHGSWCCHRRRRRRRCCPLPRYSPAEPRVAAPHQGRWQRETWIAGGGNQCDQCVLR